MQKTVKNVKSVSLDYGENYILHFIFLCRFYYCLNKDSGSNHSFCSHQKAI